EHNLPYLARLFHEVVHLDSFLHVGAVVALVWDADVVLVSAEDFLDLVHVEHRLADVGVGGALDLDGDLRDDVQQAANLVRDSPLARGQLPAAGVVLPEVLHDGLLELEQPNHHSVLTGPPGGCQTIKDTHGGA
ncbi:unnamed protein product, partial [Laminaria digitata]